MAGLVAYNYKHLYVFGIGQVRYGAGPLISTGAESLARIIDVQNQMAYPLADVMKVLGLARNATKSTKSADIIQVTHYWYPQII